MKDVDAIIEAVMDTIHYELRETTNADSAFCLEQIIEKCQKELVNLQPMLGDKENDNDL